MLEGFRTMAASGVTTQKLNVSSTIPAPFFESVRSSFFHLA
jgi:hypothetical protein